MLPHDGRRKRDAFRPLTTIVAMEDSRQWRRPVALICTRLQLGGESPFPICRFDNEFAMHPRAGRTDRARARSKSVVVARG